MVSRPTHLQRYKNLEEAADMDRFLVEMTRPKENRHEIWYMECEKYIYNEVTQGSGRRNIKIEVRFSRNTPGQMGQVDSARCSLGVRVILNYCWGLSSGLACTIYTF